MSFWRWPPVASSACAGCRRRRCPSRPLRPNAIPRSRAGRPDAADQPPLKLLLATHNEHKMREFTRLVDGASPGGDLVLERLPEDLELPPEEGSTFAQNALGKARAAAGATGRVSIADDSGISAEALGGAPGVRSARFAGERASDEENLAKLLAQAPAGSGLEYICSIAFVDPLGRVERLF